VSRQIIRDRNQILLGTIETMSDGRQKATDRNNRLLGWYDPRRDVTTDPNLRVVARGNTLAGLIYDRR
jgi:hypothetical protein